MFRSFTLALLLIAFLAGELAAKTGIVKTTDGRSLRGEVTEDARAGTVTVVSHGVTISLKREEVVSIEYPGDIRQQYEVRRAKLGPKPTAAQHFELARWLFDNAAYDLAREEAELAKAMDPRNPEIQTLLDTIVRQKYLDHPRPTTGPGVTTTRPTPLPHVYLSPEQIQAIKRYELTRADGNVIFRFEKDVEKRYAELRGGDPRAFRALTPPQRAMEIFTNGPEQMHTDVKIANDPLALLQFKVVQRSLLAGCATAACHGGTAGGPFVLHSPAETEAATYTNFYLLTQYSMLVGDIKRPAINRTQPQDSLTLQYGLPRDRARLPHPEVPQFRPAFTSDQSPAYRTILNWVSSTLRPDTVDYRIDFRLPTTRRTAPKPP